MNDVPAVVGWIIAALLAVAAGIAWLLTRHRAARPPLRWGPRTILWLLTSSTIGPLAVVTVFIVFGAISDIARLSSAPMQRLGEMLGAFLFLSIWNVAVALGFFALPYVPILLFWTRLGSRLGELERSRRGILVASVILALPATLVSIVAYGFQESPFGYQGWELVRFGLIIQFSVSLSLLVPRLLITSLRPGVFSADAERTHETAFVISPR